jgi:sporulation protein YlmC with PRC-barrel domain
MTDARPLLQEHIMQTKLNKKLLVAALCLPFAFGAGLPAVAQNATPPMPGKKSEGIKTVVRDMRASKLIGKDVKNPQGEDLGKIEDFIIDADNERVRYAILSFGGALGLGDKLFAYPAQTFRAAEKGDDLVLNVSKEQLKQAPGFDPKNRPNFSQDSYRSQVDRFFFKEDTANRTPQGVRLVSANDVIDKDVNDRAAHDAGEIKDLVINLGTGNVYAVLEFDKAWSPDEKLMPMPLKAFNFPTRPDLDIVLAVDREKIDMANGFPDDKWPDMNSANYKQQIGAQLASIRSQVKSNPTATKTGRETSTGSSTGSSSAASSGTAR